MEIKTLKSSLSSKIASMLRLEIYEQALKSGDHLNEAQIATRLGVSRGPLRDAFFMLENEGLVETPPNGRTIVLGFSAKEISEYYDLRYYLESESIRKILASSDDPTYPQWLETIETLINESRMYLQYNNEDMFVVSDLEFHLAILSRAGNKIFIQVWKTLANMSRTIMEMNKRYLSNMQLHDIGNTFAFHDRILFGLKNRDLALTLNYLEQHLKKGTETYSMIIEHVSDMQEKVRLSK